jgi:hypothetical protein
LQTVVAEPWFKVSDEGLVLEGPTDVQDGDRTFSETYCLQDDACGSPARTNGHGGPKRPTRSKHRRHHAAENDVSRSVHDGAPEVEGGLFAAVITATRLVTKSSAIADSRSIWFSAKRLRIITFSPSI